MCTLEGAIKTFQGFKVPSNFIFEHIAFEKYKQIYLGKIYLFVDFLSFMSYVQCTLDLVTLLVSAKTVTKLHDVTKSNDFM